MKFSIKRPKLIGIALLTVYGSLLVILSMSTQSARAFVGGPPTGRTGAPGETTCTGCHSPNALTGQFHIIPPAGYVPGQTYTIQVQSVTTDLSRAVWGFELTSLTPLNTVAGTFANTTTLTRTRNGGGRNYIEQTAEGAFPGQTGGSSWTFSWTAPSTDVGSITFYAAGIQGDNSGDEGGDQTYTASAVVPTGAATPTPTATATATPTATVAATPTATATAAGTPTATATAAGTPTATATAAGTPTATATGTPTPTPTPVPNCGLANISTRGVVQTGDNVLIGGFIVTGTVSKTVLIRAIGPSLAGTGVPNALADPTLELRSSSGALILANDNWRDTQQAAIIATGIPPTDNLESAILATLAPGAYTAIVRGKNNTTGSALVEVYGL